MTPQWANSYSRSPVATPAEIARQDPAFPVTNAARPRESLFADWRKRSTRNLARRSDGRWDPLTYVHEAPPVLAEGKDKVADVGAARVRWTADIHDRGET